MPTSVSDAWNSVTTLSVTSESSASTSLVMREISTPARPALVEADRHPLQVAEDLQAQVLQRALADPADEVGLQRTSRPTRSAPRPGTRRRSTSSVPVSPGTMPSSIACLASGGGRQRRRRADEQRQRTSRRRASGRARSSTSSPRSLRPRPLVPRSRRRMSSSRGREPIGVAALTGPPPPARPACASGRPGRAAPSRRSRGTARRPSSSSSCVPCATTAPCSSTTISSASAIVESRWAMTNVVRPAITSRSARLISLLGRGVHRGGRVVEDQDARVGQQRARDREALALAAAERQPALADARVVAVGQPLDELVRLRAPRRQLDLLARGVRPRVGDVLVHRRREQERVVVDDRDRAAQRARARRRARRRRRPAPRPRSRRTAAGAARRASSCPSRSRRPARPCVPAGDSSETSRSASARRALVAQRHVAQLDAPVPAGSGGASGAATIARLAVEDLEDRARPRPSPAAPCPA